MLLENFQKDVDTQKVLRLLGAKKGRRVSAASLRRVDVLTGEIEGMLKPQLSYRILELEGTSPGGIQLSDGTRLKSSKIAKSLAKAEKVCCFLATIGPAIDMEIERLMQHQRYANAYVLDALGSMSAENVVEQFYRRMARRQIEKNAGVTLRFSPGYCDWPLKEQWSLFRIFDKTDTPDVVLSDSCLMSPRKSISGLFGLLSGIHLVWSSMLIPAASKKLISIGVVVVPGLTELTLMLYGAHSIANSLVRARTPPLLAQYAAPVTGPPLCPDTDAILTILPCFRSTICLPTAWAQRNVPLRLISRLASQSASDISTAGAPL